jgi:hypothetical protein
LFGKSLLGISFVIALGRHSIKLKFHLFIHFKNT